MYSPYHLMVPLFVGFILVALPLSASENMIAARGGGGYGHSNEMYSGNRFDQGNMDSNRMYSGNAYDSTRADSNRMYSGNATDSNRADSNRMYSGNATDNTYGQSNRMYNGLENNRNYNPYYQAAPVEPVVPVYGYSSPVAPNSQVFPDSTESNALYWNEVQQMEQGR